MAGPSDRVSTLGGGGGNFGGQPGAAGVSPGGMGGAGGVGSGAGNQPGGNGASGQLGRGGTGGDNVAAEAEAVSTEVVAAAQEIANINLGKGAGAGGGGGSSSAPGGSVVLSAVGTPAQVTISYTVLRLLHQRLRRVRAPRRAVRFFIRFVSQSKSVNWWRHGHRGLRSCSH